MSGTTIAAGSSSSRALASSATSNGSGASAPSRLSRALSVRFALVSASPSAGPARAAEPRDGLTWTPLRHRLVVARRDARRGAAGRGDRWLASICAQHPRGGREAVARAASARTDEATVGYLVPSDVGCRAKHARRGHGGGGCASTVRETRGSRCVSRPFLFRFLKPLVKLPDTRQTTMSSSDASSRLPPSRRPGVAQRVVRERRDERRRDSRAHPRVDD